MKIVPDMASQNNWHNSGMFGRIRSLKTIQLHVFQIYKHKTNIIIITYTHLEKETDRDRERERERERKREKKREQEREEGIHIIHFKG